MRHKKVLRPKCKKEQAENTGIVQLHQSQHKKPSRAALKEKARSWKWHTASRAYSSNTLLQLLSSQSSEAALVSYIGDISACGYEYSRQQLGVLVSETACLMKTVSETDVMSDSWLQQFIARWPELDISEKDSITKESIDNYYRELMRLMQKHDLLNKPDHIFCVYDTVLDTNHRVGVVNNYRVMPSQYTELTVMNCMNAAGHVLPPYIVFSGKRMTRDLVADGLPGTGGTTAPNGKMNSRSFLKFLKDHFLPIVPCSRDHPVLLLYDGYRPYVNMPLINWAKRQFIVPYLLPPHVCHSQQPKQDSAVFPLKAAYQHQCRQFLLDNIGRIVTRYDVCNIIGRAYQQVMTQEVIIPSFRDMGIVPYNPAAKPMGDIDDMKNTKIGDTRVKTEHVLVEVKTEQLEEVSVKTETF